MQEMAKKKKDEINRLKEIEKRFAEISSEYYYDIAGLMEMLEIEYDRANNRPTSRKLTGHSS